MSELEKGILNTESILLVKQEKVTEDKSEEELQAALDEFLQKNPEPTFEPLVLEEPPKEPIQKEDEDMVDYLLALEEYEIKIEEYERVCKLQKEEYEQNKFETLQSYEQEKANFIEGFKIKQQEAKLLREAELEKTQSVEKKKQRREKIIVDFNSFDKPAFIAERNTALENLTMELGKIETEKGILAGKIEKSELFLNNEEKLAKFKPEMVEKLREEYATYKSKIKELGADILEKQNEQEKIRKEIEGAGQKHSELFEQVKEIVSEECVFNYDAVPFKIEKPQDEYLGGGIKIFLTGEGHIDGESGRLVKGMPDNLYEVLAKYNFGPEQKKLVLTAVADKLQDNIKERALEQSGLGKEKELLLNAQEKINNRLEGIKSAKEDVGYLLLAYLRERMPEAKLEQEFLYPNSRDKGWLRNQTHGEWVFDQISASVKANNSKFATHLNPRISKSFVNGLYGIMAILANDKPLYEKIVIAPSPENLRVIVDALEGAPEQKELIDQYKAWGNGEGDSNDFPEAKKITVEDSHYASGEKNPSVLCNDKLSMHSYGLERSGNVVNLSMEELAAMGIKPDAQMVKRKMDDSRSNYARSYSISINSVTDQMLYSYNKNLDLSSKSAYELMNDGYYSREDLQKISNMYKEKNTSQRIIEEKERILNSAIQRTAISSNLNKEKMSENAAKLIEEQFKPKEYQTKTGQTREQFNEEFEDYRNEENTVDSFKRLKTLESLKENIKLLTPAITFFAEKGYKEPVKIFVNGHSTELVLSFTKSKDFIEGLQRPLDNEIAAKEKEYAAREGSYNFYNKKSDLETIAGKIRNLRSQRESLNNEIYAATREFDTDSVGSKNAKLVDIGANQNAEFKAATENAGAVSYGSVDIKDVENILNSIATGLEASLLAKAESVKVKEANIKDKQAIWNEINRTK